MVGRCVLFGSDATGMQRARALDLVAGLGAASESGRPGWGEIVFP